MHRAVPEWFQSSREHVMLGPAIRARVHRRAYLRDTTAQWNGGRDADPDRIQRGDWSMGFPGRWNQRDSSADNRSQGPGSLASSLRVACLIHALRLVMARADCPPSVSRR